MKNCIVDVPWCMSFHVIASTLSGSRVTVKPAKTQKRRQTLLALPSTSSSQNDSDEFAIDDNETAEVFVETVETVETVGTVQREDQPEQASKFAIETAEVTEAPEAPVETQTVEGNASEDQTNQASGASATTDSIQIFNSFDPFQSLTSPFARKKRFFST